MRRIPWLLVIVQTILSCSLLAQEPAKPVAPPSNCALESSLVAPGESLSFKCDNGQGPKTVYVYFKAATDSSSGKGTPLASVMKQDGTFTYRVPDSIQPGQYSVAVAFGTNVNDQSAIVPVQLEVAGPPVIDSIYALTNYRGAHGFDFEIAGKNFRKSAGAAPGGAAAGGTAAGGTGNSPRKSSDEDVIEIVGLRMLGSCGATPPATSDTPCGEVAVIPPNRIKVTGFYPRYYFGPLKIKVHAGSQASQEASVSFAPVTQQGVALAAAGIFFAIAYVLFVLVRRGLTSDAVDGKKPSPFASLFLDRETNSYSLSKFQVIAWTAVTVYSYVYLFLCRTLIQGDFRFPDVSQNLPQLFFISAGTTVVAAAITANVGSKGAGPIHPSAADFISTGGLVAGDRFQFFTWTLVGCIGYVYLVIKMNPETPNIALPDIPQNFLYLMGVSSAGYLGGKVVRKPGPIIKVLSIARITSLPPAAGPPDPDAINAQARTALGVFSPKKAGIRVTPPILTFNLRGENLDPDGSVKIGDDSLRGDMFWMDGQPDPQNSGFCSELNLSLNAAAQYLEGTHQLTLVNTDGQGASFSFPVDPMVIDFIPDLAHTAPNDPAISVSVTGKNFVTAMNGTNAEWRNPSTAAQAADAPITNVSGTKLTVNLTPGPAGTGKLTLISPTGLRTSRDLNVK